ncbi:MAG: hypothetical protein RR554_11170 [Vagococcus sp.]|uniref:hypothetical protein n=1 Tax=Vagococcus sp. TaxID=1933889 RepID=UPI002FC8965D
MNVFGIIGNLFTSLSKNEEVILSFIKIVDLSVDAAINIYDAISERIKARKSTVHKQSEESTETTV